MSIRLKYFIIGALFGMCFPVGALIIEFQRLSLTFNLANLKFVHSENLILYMIDSAPIFLGLFALLGGISKEKSVQLIQQFRQVAVFLSKNTDTLKHQSENSFSEYIESINKLTADYSSIDRLNRSTFSEIHSTLEGTSKVGNEIDKMKSSLNQISNYNTDVGDNHTKIKEYLKSYLGNIKKLNDYFSYLNDFSKEIEILAINSSIEANKHGAQGKTFMVFAQNIQHLAQETKSKNLEVLKLMGVVSEETKCLDNIIDTERENIENIIHLADQVNSTTTEFEDVINGFIQSLQEATEHLDKQNNLTSDFGETLDGISESNRHIMLQLQNVVKKQISIIQKMDMVASN